MGKYVEIIWCGKSILCGYVRNKKYICDYVVKSVLVKVNIYICGKSENVNKYG